MKSNSVILFLLIVFSLSPIKHCSAQNAPINHFINLLKSPLDEVEKINWGSIHYKDRESSFWCFYKGNWHLIYPTGNNNTICTGSVIDYFFYGDDIYILTSVRNRDIINNVIIRQNLANQKDRDTINIKFTSDNYGLDHFSNGALSCVDINGRKYYQFADRAYYFNATWRIKNLPYINQRGLSLIEIYNSPDVNDTNYHKALFLHTDYQDTIISSSINAFFVTDTILAVNRGDIWTLDFIDIEKIKDSIGARQFNRYTLLADNNKVLKYLFMVSNTQSYLYDIADPTTSILQYDSNIDSVLFFSNSNTLLLKNSTIGWVKKDMSGSMSSGYDTLNDNSYQLIPMSNDHLLSKKGPTDSIWHVTHYSNHKLNIIDSIISQQDISEINSNDRRAMIFENCYGNLSNSSIKKKYCSWLWNFKTNERVVLEKKDKILSYENIIFYKTDSVWSVKSFSRNLKKYTKSSVSNTLADSYTGFSRITTKPIYFLPSLNPCFIAYKGNDWSIIEYCEKVQKSSTNIPRFKLRSSSSQIESVSKSSKKKAHA